MRVLRAWLEETSLHKTTMGEVGIKRCFLRSMPYATACIARLAGKAKISELAGVQTVPRGGIRFHKGKLSSLAVP